MDLSDIANHLFNFAAPALSVALLLALFACAARGGETAAGGLLRGFWKSFWVNAAVGCTVLVAGLGVFGRDGKMSTYAALIVACGSSQWLLGCRWRDRSRPPDAG